MEIWKPIPGYEGLYEASDQGRIRSLDRVVKRGSGNLSVSGRIIAQNPGNKYGHLYSMLWKDGEKKYIQVHSLVLRAFVGPAPDGMECLHGDKGKLCNRLTNLRYGSRKENINQIKEDGTGNYVGAPKLSLDEVREIRRRRDEGETCQRIADDFGVDRGRVSRISRRISFGWVKDKEEEDGE